MAKQKVPPTHSYEENGQRIDVYPYMGPPLGYLERDPPVTRKNREAHVEKFLDGDIDLDDREAQAIRDWVQGTTPTRRYDEEGWGGEAHQLMNQVFNILMRMHDPVAENPNED